MNSRQQYSFRDRTTISRIISCKRQGKGTNQERISRRFRILRVGPTAQPRHAYTCHCGAEVSQRKRARFFGESVDMNNRQGKGWNQRRRRVFFCFFGGDFGFQVEGRGSYISSTPTHTEIRSQPAALASEYNRAESMITTDTGGCSSAGKGRKGRHEGYKSVHASSCSCCC